MRYARFLIFIVILAIVPLLSQAQDNTLPSCTEAEAQVLNNTVIPEFQALLANSYDILESQNIDDLLVFADAQLQWRDNALPLFPSCKEAVKLGTVMNQLSSDLIIFFAFQLAGVPDINNPYQDRTLQNSRSLIDLFSPLETTATLTLTITPFATNTPQPVVTKTYYVISNGTVNIRSCASTDCGVVSTSNRGDALTVVDDSGDWYQLQLNNGDTGYIADFLVGVNAPSSQPIAAPAKPTAIPQNNIQSNVQPTAVPVQPTVAPVSTVAVQSEAQPPSDGQICGGATTCGAMSSCEQAYACLRAGRNSLDRDKDGVPCESICPGG